MNVDDSICQCVDGFGQLPVCGMSLGDHYKVAEVSTQQQLGHFRYYRFRNL